jgi:hypothetical protein
VWSLTLVLLAADAGAYRIFSIADYMHDPHLIGVCLMELPILAGAVAGIMLTSAGCSQVAPVGPTPPPVPSGRHLGSPIILQPMRSQAPSATGRCPAGWVAVPAGSAGASCYHPVGTRVTITVAAVAAVASDGQAPPGRPAQFGFSIEVPEAEVSGCTACSSRPDDP